MSKLLPRLIITGLALILAGCITVEREVQLSCEVEPVDPGWDRVVAPFYFGERVDLFRKALLQSSSEIVVVDAAILWHAVFPDRDPDAEARVSEFRRPDISARVWATGVRHMIVLDTAPSTTKGDPVLTMIYNTQTETTTRKAVMVTFQGERCEIDSYRVIGEGRDHMGWYYVGYYFDADTAGESLRVLTERMVQFMEQEDATRPVKVVIVGAR
jgi:hypothetical protein